MKKSLIAIAMLLVAAQTQAAPVSSGRAPKKGRASKRASFSQLAFSKTTLKRPVTVRIGVRGKKCPTLKVRMAKGSDTKKARIPARCCVSSVRVTGVGGLTLASVRFRKCLRGSASFNISRIASGKAAIRVRKK